MKPLDATNYWPLLESYFREKSFAKQEIDSFNYFLDYKLPQIVEENKTVTPKIEEVKLELSGIEVLRPRIIEADGSPRTLFYPMEARIRNRTYSSPVFLTMKLLRRDVEQDVKKTYIGDVPIMVKSNRCWLYGKTEDELVEMGEDPKDFGGYFIVNGSEKALMTQEVLASDRVIISEKTQERVSAEVISTRGAFKGRVRITRTPDGMLGVTFPASPKKLRLFVLLKALGLKTKREIMDAFPEEMEIQNDVLLNLENTPVKDQNEALDRIGKFVAPGQVLDYRLRRAKEVIDAFLLPHIGQKEEDRLAKAYYLSTMATKAIEHAYNLRPEDDKDHYANKRLELSGKLMEHLFRYAFKYFIKDLTFQIDRTITRRRKLNINTVVRPGAISERIRFAMSTGNWIGRATGVSKFMDRTNYLSPLTDLRKVKSPLDKNRELYEARDVHGTHWGRLCVDKDTSVLMADGISQEPIKNLANQWREKAVMTIDQISKQFVPSTLKAYQMFNPPTPTIQIETEAGRTLVATIDHPILNDKNQWIDSGKLSVGDRVVIFPTLEKIPDRCTEKTILDEKTVKRFYPHNATKIIKKLKEKKLFPLTTQHENLPVIARLFGFMLTDGYLGKSHTEFYLGDERDVAAMKRDIQQLGIEPGIEETQEGEIEINKRKTTRRIFALLHRAELRPLMLLLGMPMGRKTNLAYSIQDWIKNSSPEVKREFLAGVLGGDGPKPRIDTRKERKNSSKVRLDGIVFHKKKGLEKEGIRYANQLKELFALFGVSIKSITTSTGYVRKDGSQTIKFYLKFSNSRESIANLTQKIGYRYCIQKQEPSNFIAEYLRIRKKAINDRKKLKKRIIQLNAHHTPTQISRALGIKRKFIQTVLERKGKFKETVASRTVIQPIHEWVQQSVLPSSLVLEKIVRIEPVKCNDVRDFTTREQTHSFIANGFVTHNCPIETPDGPQCVAPETGILLEDYSTMSIGEFENHWQKTGIASVDWNTETKEEKPANIVRYLKMHPTKKVVEVKTRETGRTIKATLEHPFYSERNGKTELQTLAVGDRVAVLPIQPLHFEPATDRTIVTEEDVLKVCPPKTDTKNVAGVLKKAGLVPLKENNQNLLIIARLVGHLFGDGSLTLSMKKFKSACTLVFSGTKNDLDAIRQDLQKLGFNVSKTTTWHKKSVLANGQIIEGNSIRMDCYSKPLWVLFKALGAPAGDKAIVSATVPNWLLGQRRAIQKEFLASFFGSEMTKPSIDKRNRKIFLQPSFSLNKVSSRVQNGIAFASGIEQMLKQFNVGVSQIKIVKGTERKNGTETKKIKVLLKSDLESLGNLYGSIGFEYCQERKSLARFAFSYLSAKKHEIEKRKQVLQTVLALASKGQGKKKILDTTDYEVREHDVANWLKKIKNGKTVKPRVSEIDFPTFAEWIREHAVSENGLVWETIESLKETDCADVRDVTTRQEYHNFFANGFLTGNCGLVKNLALLAEVTTEAEEDPIEKALYKMGVKLKK